MTYSPLSYVFYLSVINEADDSGGEHVDVNEVDGRDVHAHAHLSSVNDGLYSKELRVNYLQKLESDAKNK